MNARYNEELLKKLLDSLAPLGNEGNMANTIAEEIRPYVDEVTIDPVMGNCIAVKRCGKPNAKKLMIAAHMDEIGIMVNYIEDNGYVRVSALGGLGTHRAAYNVVRFLNGTKGLLVCDGGVSPNDLTIDRMYVDIGAKNKEEASKMLRVGDVGAVLGQYTVLNNMIAAKSLDNKIACYIAIEAAKLLKNPAYDVYFTFTTIEENGQRGAKTSAYAIDPDYCIVLDVTLTNDTPGAAKINTKQGGGAAIKVRDALIICHHKMVDHLIGCAEKNEIPYQLEVITAGGTDGGVIHTSRAGIITGGISIPSRYIHTPVETVDLDDVINDIDLLVAALETDIEA